MTSVTTADTASLRSGSKARHGDAVFRRLALGGRRCSSLRCSERSRSSWSSRQSQRCGPIRRASGPPRHGRPKHAIFGIAAHAVRHRADHRAGAGHGGAGRDRRRALHHAVRPSPDRNDARLRHRHARRRAQRRLRLVGTELPAPAHVRRAAVPRHVLRLDPAVQAPQRARQRLQQVGVRRVGGARHHGAADRRGDQPRGLPSGRPGAEGSRARPRRDALGDDPDGGPARRAGPASSARSCSASAARSARPSPSRW